MTAFIASPCVGVCQLDARQCCRGCGRTLDEIAEWPLARPDRQQAIVAAARQRQATRTATTGEPRDEPPAA